MPERNRRREVEVLTQAGFYLPDPGPFTAAVTTRLDAVEARHGNTGWSGLERIADEIVEEGIDISGWGVGFDLLLAASEFGDTERDLLHTRLMRAMTHGAMAWDAARELAAGVRSLTVASNGNGRP